MQKVDKITKVVYNKNNEEAVDGRLPRVKLKNSRPIGKQGGYFLLLPL